MINGSEYLWVALAAMAAGMINALAGGGTLITFPVLTFFGLPAVSANVTNTVALLPGYLGATAAQRKDLAGQRKRLLMFIPTGLLGGLLGGILLLQSGEKLFSELVPYLILGASALLALQDPLRRYLQKRMTGRQASEKQIPIEGNTNDQVSVPNTPHSEVWAILPIFLAAIYGGYFGAGVSVIVLAVLGLVLEDTLTRLNALKQLISFSANLAAAIYFLFSGQVVWLVALVMMVGALIGGNLGGRLAGRIKPATLRWIVVSIGTVVGVIYLVR
jgi:uncharacterized membrane protein YfcA